MTKYKIAQPYIVTFLKLYAYSENISLPAIYHARIFTSLGKEKAIEAAKRAYSQEDYGDVLSVIGPLKGLGSIDIYWNQNDGILVRDLEDTDED